MNLLERNIPHIICHRHCIDHFIIKSYLLRLNHAARRPKFRTWGLSVLKLQRLVQYLIHDGVDSCHQLGIEHANKARALGVVGETICGTVVSKKTLSTLQRYGPSDNRSILHELREEGLRREKYLS